MKKLALLLGSLLVVGATASAKEVVVAPVEVSKEVVVVAEPVVEVVVLEEAFRPSGYIGVEYRAYGKTEGHGDKIIMDPVTNQPATDQDTWNRGLNDYARLQTSFGIQMTEKSRLEARIRDYHDLERADSTREVNGGKDGTETRLRYFYKHNSDLTSRLQYRDEENNSQNFEYKLLYNAYSNKGGLLSSFSVQPNIYHSMPKDNGGNYLNSIGIDFGYAGNLPFGFTWDGTIYLDQNFYNNSNAIQKGVNSTTDKEFVVTWELYLYRTFALYSTDDYELDFNFEGGYDPYVFRQYDRYSLDKKTNTYKKSDKDSYSLYTSMNLSVNYQLTPAISLNGGVGAEYRNWDNENQSSANDWRWQPYAFAGMKVNF
ncbi:FomA family porin-like outer membrane protein [Cetobacterium sp.]